MDDIRIRGATQSDALNLTALSIQVWLDNYATEGLRNTLSEYVLAEFTDGKLSAIIDDPDSLMLVAEKNEHIIAYLQAALGRATTLHTSEKQAEIDHVYVQEPFCKSGVGSALMKEGEKQLADLGYDLVWLSAWEHNDRALKFYEKLGYDKLGTADFVMGEEREVNVVFGKRLS
jgi:ribosomal protein S18 acetylase RimI-like enzyme